MRVPVRRQPETRISQQQQSFARPVAPLNVEPINRLVEGFRDQMLDEQDARQRIDLNRRLLREVNELQLDFAARQTNPEEYAEDFAERTNVSYSERHAALVAELRQGGYSQDLIDDFDARLGTVRQGFFERGLAHQIAQLTSRAGEEIEDVGRQASQYAAVDPIHNYETARETVRNSVRTHPDLREDQRAALEDQELAVVRDGAARALEIQNPQAVVDALDPQGLTAPYPTTPAATTGETPTVAPEVTSASARADFKARVRVNESGGNDRIVNRRGSGASGRYQFMQGTFVEMHRRVYGGNMTPAQRWALRFDPDVQERLMDASITLYEEALRGANQPITAGNLYLSHFLGPDDAVNVLRQPTLPLRDILRQRHSESFVNRVFQQNPNLRRNMVGADVIALTARAMGGAAQATAVASTEAPAFRPDPQALAAAADGSRGPAPSFLPSPEEHTSIPATAPTPPPGLRAPGNINLTNRPTVTNTDGTVSTIRSISIHTDQGEVLIPTVVNGAVVSDEAAAEHYRQTGEHLGVFDTPENATAYAQQLHNDEARRTGNIAAVRTGIAVLDDLSGPERMQTLARARERLTQRTASQRAEMDVRIGNIIAEVGNGIATPVPTQEELIRLYGPVEGPQRFAQVQQAIETDRVLPRFRTQSAEAIQRDLDSIRPTPGTPTYAAELQIYQAAERAAQTVLTQRREDPVGYVMQNFPAVREAAQRGTAQYYAALDRAYQTLGIDTRNAPVLTAEAAQNLTRNYRTMNAAQRGQFIEQNMEEMGEQRFRRFVDGMEGTTAATDARIYALLRHYPGAGVTRNLYNEILEGREVIAQDPAKRPREAEVTQVFRQVGLHAVRDLDPEVSRSIQEATVSLYARRGGDPVHINRTLYREALTAVLGGNLPADMRRGRVPDYTILPPRVSEQQFRTWMERQTIATLRQFGTEGQAPRWGDLRTPVPIQTIIDEGVFVMVSPGYYSIRMASDGRPLMTPSGNRYIMRINSHGLMNIRAGQPAQNRPPPRVMGGGVM